MLVNCPECRAQVSDEAATCPRCGHPFKAVEPARFRRGFEWKSQSIIFGLPLIHVAFGRSRRTGKMMVAKGIFAVGQFGLGVFTFAQFGLGLIFGFGQFVGAPIAIGQFALGIIFGLGQFASGSTAIGQMAFGRYVLAQIGLGEHVWSTKIKDPAALEHFSRLWQAVPQAVPGFGFGI